ncbi:MAG: VanW family protein [Coriobacteriia bacterium]
MTDSERTPASHARGGRHGSKSAHDASHVPGWMASWPLGARIGLISVGVLAVVLIGLAVADLAITGDRIHAGVQVGAVDVGGMTRSVAARAIADDVAERAATPVNLAVEGESWDVSAESIGLSVDATGLASAAHRVGRGDFLQVVSSRARATFGEVIVPLELACDDDSMTQLVESINTAIAQPPKDAAVVVEGASVTRVSPADGHGVDIDEARDAILEAFLSDEHTAVVGLVTLQPAIDEARADGAYEAARAMVSAPLELYYEDKTWTVEPATIGGWIGFRSAESTDGPVLEAYIASAEVSSTILPLVAEVGRPAKDASFSTSAGTVTVVPAEDGLSADAEDLATRLEAVLTEAGERRAELTMRRVEAALTTEEASDLGIVERLSTFTTEYSSSNKPRVNNIHTLSDALDNTLVEPGGTFSFNGSVGERTAAKGYEEAPAIVNGKLVPQLGGGICQVNTTLFNAVFFSGLPVVERRNHSQYISHYPKGRDATVSWGGPDFKFKNDTPNWILIATGYTNSSVTISIYGTDPGYEVVYETGPWTNITNPPVREVKDASLPVGTRVIDERGVSGRTIVVTRIVTKGGVEIRRDAFKSVYRPTEEIVRVGTKPAAVPSTPTTSTP